MRLTQMTFYIRLQLRLRTMHIPKAHLTLKSHFLHNKCMLKCRRSIHLAVHKPCIHTVVCKLSDFNKHHSKTASSLHFSSKRMKKKKTIICDGMEFCKNGRKSSVIAKPMYKQLNVIYRKSSIKWAPP